MPGQVTSESARRRPTGNWRERHFLRCPFLEKLGLARRGSVGGGRCCWDWGEFGGFGLSLVILRMDMIEQFWTIIYG